MYRSILRLLISITLMTAFWSVLRIRGITVFDWFAPLTVIAAIPNRARHPVASRVAFQLPVAGIFLLVFGGLISAGSSTDVREHLQKVSALFAAFTMMLVFAWLLSTRKLLSLKEVLLLLAISGTIHSAVVTLQGQFGFLTGIIPDLPTGVRSWTRMTGLAEHPIETGTITAFAILISLGLAIITKRWFYGFPVLLGIYSLRFSASLTATLSLLAAACVLIIVSRSWPLLLACMVGTGLIVAASLSAGSQDSLLDARLHVLARDRGNYSTLQDREEQYRETFSQMDAGSLFFGNGYSTADLPENMEIHNTLLGALFHFGIFGLVSQCLLVWFFIGALWARLASPVRGTLLACIIVFGATYLTGPTLSRRSVWIPLILMGAYVRVKPKSKLRRTPRTGYLPFASETGVPQEI